MYPPVKIHNERGAWTEISRSDPMGLLMAVTNAMQEMLGVILGSQFDRGPGMEELSTRITWVDDPSRPVAPDTWDLIRDDFRRAFDVVADFNSGEDGTDDKGRPTYTLRGTIKPPPDDDK